MGLSRCRVPHAALCLLAGAAPVAAQGTAPPPYESVRHDEDYRYLKDTARRTDPFDAIKYIRLSDAKEDWFLALGGEVRGRFEYFHDEDWDGGSGSDGFLLQRYMLHGDLHLGRRLRLFAHVKSALENGRAAGPRPPDEDRLDLHEAFIDVGLGSTGAQAIRIGRQELSFGSQRLVSIRRGPNVRRSFDGVGVNVRSGGWKLDAFAARPVETDAGHFDDGPDHTRTFWGVYAVGPLRAVEAAGVDLYYLGLDREDANFDQGTAMEVRETAGARIWREDAPWDCDFEVVYQWGRFGSAPIRAWTFASDTGFTFGSAPWRPRVGLKADVTSGDRNPGDPALQSFNPLFPRGAYFGENQLIGPINHIDLHPSVELRPLPAITVGLSWVFFWRESLRDGLYDVAGNLVRSGAGTDARYVGSQPALTVTWVLNRHLTIAFDYEHFLAGPFIRETGPGDDVSFLAGWFEVTF
jgi:hypothetical protein